MKNQTLFLLMVMAGCFLHEAHIGSGIINATARAMGLFLAFEGTALFICTEIRERI